VPTHVSFTLDDAAVESITRLRARVASEGIAVPSDEPAVVVAAASVVPQDAREAVLDEVRLLGLPSIWLATLGTVAGRPDALVLAAVVDTELLAVHGAIHDALAGRVKNPVSTYFPGAWLPSCTLAAERPADAFAALHPVAPVRARVTGVSFG
jgi:hypothetical protein